MILLNTIQVRQYGWKGKMPYNKRMQSDQNARYAFILTADSGR